MAVLLSAGDQFPVIPFVEVVGKGAKVSPEQIEAIGAKVGTTFGLTVMVNVCEFAHCPTFGEKV